MDFNFDGILPYKKIDREYTQDFVPIKDIKNGVIIANYGGKTHYIKLLEIIPLNFSLLSPDEQDSIVLLFRDLLRSAPASFHIKIITKRTDINSYLEAAEKAKAEEPLQSCRDLIDNYMQYIYTMGAYNSVERHYYFIFEFDQAFSSIKVTEEEGIINVLNQKAAAIMSDFNTMGNKAIDWGGNAKEIAKVLYSFYNPGISIAESFEERVERIEHDTMVTHNVEEGQNPGLDIRDIISPKSIDFMNPSYILIDGIYQSRFYVQGSGYPNYMSTNGWLAAYIGLDYGIDTDLYFFKGNSAEKIRAIQNHAKLSNIRISQKESEEIDYNSALSNYEGTRFMMDALQTGGEEFYDMVAMFTANSLSYQGLCDIKKELMDRAIKWQVGMAECKRRQEPAFFMTAPYMDVDSTIKNLAKHNITTNSVAAAYPFTSFSLNDKDGILMGLNRNNGTMVIYDPFDTDHYVNANMTIFGETGHGKTYTLLTILMRLRCQGIQIFAFAPDKQDEFRRACDAVGGIFVDISPSSQQRINIFDIRPLTSPENEKLGGNSYTDKSWLIDKVDNLKIWLDYIIPGLTPAGKAVLETHSVYKDKARKELKEMPIMQDLYDAVIEAEERGDLSHDITLILSQFITGAASNMNGHTNVDLDNKFVVLGLENLKGDLMAPTMFSILEMVWGKCRENRTKKKMIAIDEGWQLLNGANKQVGEFVQEIFKVIRGFGGGAMFSTQSVSSE